MEHHIKVALTGGTGQISYSVIFSLANGDAFGPKMKIDLRIYDIEGTLPMLKGILMEIEDGAYPLIQRVSCSNDLREAFEHVDVALLVGALPRTIGMERKDLLFANKDIFTFQGKILNEVANKDVKVFVVGNPANTNCLVALNNAPSLNPRNFHSLMRLDQNRMHSLLAKKAKVSLEDVQGGVVWGNHSLTQVPDYTQAMIKGISAEDYIKDSDWFEQQLIPTIQNRGGAILQARGKSSSASAARALICAIRSLFCPQKGEIFSSGVFSKGNSYGIADNLVFGFPCRIVENGDYEIVNGLPLNERIYDKIRVTEKELLEERILANI